MPRPRKYPTPADKQKAYRRRRQPTISEFPKPAGPKTIPGTARWKALVAQAEQLLQTAHDEMEAYFQERSETWQESERGDNFRERLELIQNALEAIA